ncbi:MAG: respiratory nitrate reductase subunit gamma [Bacteroidia bacterium]|nr:respiratory nitrate reductase subunit gamma [Bacteroidia bacterium]
MVDIFIFMALPYTALLIMIIGSVFMYRLQAFKISALSTQLLENKQLYFGSQFMHWGIISLFIGHLLGFLIPQTIISWNNQPLRLFILEGTALIFGIMFFTGLSILIYRRIKNKKLHALTSDMDFIVYAVLLTQAISGIWIAVVLPWGSSWFASVLTPYIKSLFVLQPDIAAVSAMPLVVKIHISTAFILIGLIPFSRFMHFLVFPFQYVFRAYQVVIWNRNKSTIRNSTAINPEIKAKNN